MRPHAADVDKRNERKPERQRAASGLVAGGPDELVLRGGADEKEEEGGREEEGEDVQLV